MGDQPHSPEPWLEKKQGGKFGILKAGEQPIHGSFTLDMVPLSVENFRRARKCVNAMAGVPDPVDLMVRIRSRVEHYQKQMDKLAEECRETLGEPGKSRKCMLIEQSIRSLESKVRDIGVLRQLIKDHEILFTSCGVQPLNWETDGKAEEE